MEEKVTQRVGKKVFTFVKTDDGKVVRRVDYRPEVTSQEIEAKNALSSRHYTVIVDSLHKPLQDGPFLFPDECDPDMPELEEANPNWDWPGVTLLESSVGDDSMSKK
jgi:hypothetical protein